MAADAHAEPEPLDRVAVQVAVLSSLREASGGDAVWPATTIAELHLDRGAVEHVALELSGLLYIDVTVADVHDAGTVEALIDRLRGEPRPGPAISRTRRTPARAGGCPRTGRC